MNKTKPIIQSESMILPFNGNHIFYSSLDGLGESIEMAQKKFSDDLIIIKKPSSPTLVAIHLYGTKASKELAQFIVSQLKNSNAFVKKIAFVGVKRLGKRKIVSTIKDSDYKVVYSFFDDYEKAKLWLVS